MRNGKIALVVQARGPRDVDYRFDDTRPDARNARLLADDAIQRGAGRVDPTTTSDSLVREAGSRYIDFVIPGLLGMNIMGGSIWGVGFAIVDHGKVIALGSPRQLIESLGAEHVVEFALEARAPRGGGDDARDGLEAESLKKLPGVQGARLVDDGYELSVGELHRAVPALLSVLAERNLELSKLTTHSATLEDVFVHLTGRQLREA
jgi:hypothetical protein